MSPDAIAAEIDRIMLPENARDQQESLTALEASCRVEVERCQCDVYLRAAEALEGPVDEPVARAREAKAFRELTEARQCHVRFHTHLKSAHGLEFVNPIMADEVKGVMRGCAEVMLVHAELIGAVHSLIEAHNKLLEDARVVASNGPLLDPDPLKRCRTRKDAAWHRIHDGYHYLQWSSQGGLQREPPRCRCTLPKFDRCEVCHPTPEGSPEAPAE